MSIGRDQLITEFLGRTIEGPALTKADTLALLATVPAELSKQIRPNYRDLRQSTARECIDFMLAHPRYAAVPRKTAEAFFVGLAMLNKFHHSKDRALLLQMSAKARRNAPKRYARIGPLKERWNKFVRVRDYWLTGKAQHTMQTLLIVGLVGQLGATVIKIGTLRPLYPILVPFIMRGGRTELSGGDFSLDGRWRTFADRDTSDDRIYRRIRRRFEELEKSAGDGATAINLGRQLLSKVQASIQRIP